MQTHQMKEIFGQSKGLVTAKMATVKISDNLSMSVEDEHCSFLPLHL